MNSPWKPWRGRDGNLYRKWLGRILQVWKTYGWEDVKNES